MVHSEYSKDSFPPASIHLTDSDSRYIKAIYGHAPGYLTDLIAIKVQTRYTLRSASGLTLNYPSVKLKKTLGDRAFSSAAPTLWNSLPLHIRLVDNFERFKSVLKTHLFKLAFDM